MKLGSQMHRGDPAMQAEANGMDLPDEISAAHGCKLHGNEPPM